MGQPEASEKSGRFPRARGLASCAALVLLARASFAQQREPYVQDPDHATPAAEHALSDDPGHAFEFAIGGDGLAFGYRSSFHRGNGYGALGLFVNEDDDVALQARILRFGEPSAETPLALGIGLGAFAAFVDETDSELGAITLTGAIDYAFDLEYPVRVGLELSYAPDVATFFDGQRMLDVLGRVEADLSTWATAFVGYRHLEADIEDDDDAELDSALQVGVRLGF